MSGTGRTDNRQTANGRGVNSTQVVEGSMITLLKRREIQVVLSAGHSQGEVARLARVSERSVRRIAAEQAVEHVDDGRERVERRIGRPRKVDRFRALVEQLLQEIDDDRSPPKSVEILRRARLDGYDGGKTALYGLVAELRPRHTRVMMRFEGLPDEFSQHDFAQVRLRYLDGTPAVVKFFGSRLKWSRSRRSIWWTGRTPRRAGAHAGRALRAVRRGAAVRGVRSAQDGGAEVERPRRSHRMESGVRPTRRWSWGSRRRCAGRTGPTGRDRWRTWLAG